MATQAFKDAVAVLLLGGIPASTDGSRQLNVVSPERAAPSDISEKERLNPASNFLQTVTSSQILLGTLAIVAVIGVIAFVRK